MTVTGLSFPIWYGADTRIVDSLAGVTLTGTELFEATFRNRTTGILQLTKAGAITANGPPAIVEFTITDTDVELLSLESYRFAAWRVDDGSEKPYSVGTATVKHTARSG